MSQAKVQTYEDRAKQAARHAQFLADCADMEKRLQRDEATNRKGIGPARIVPLFPSRSHLTPSLSTARLITRLCMSHPARPFSPRDGSERSLAIFAEQIPGLGTVRGWHCGFHWLSLRSAERRNGEGSLQRASHRREEFRCGIRKRVPGERAEHQRRGRDAGAGGA